MLLNCLDTITGKILGRTHRVWGGGLQPRLNNSWLALVFERENKKGRHGIQTQGESSPPCHKCGRATVRARNQCAHCKLFTHPCMQMSEPSDCGTSPPCQEQHGACLHSSAATETSWYRLDGASKPAITCSLPQCPSHHLSPFTLLLIAHLITTDLTVIAGVCCRAAEKRIRNIYPFSQHKCVKVCSRFYEAWSKPAAFPKSRGVNCWGIARWLLPARCVSPDRSTDTLLCRAETGVRKETISWWKVGRG